MHRVCFMSVCGGAQHWEHVRPATYKLPPRGFSLRLPWLVCTAWGASSWSFTGLWAEWAHSNTRPHLTWGAMSSQDTREEAFAKRCSTMFKSSLMFQLQSPWSWKIRERERERRCSAAFAMSCFSRRTLHWRCQRSKDMSGRRQGCARRSAHGSICVRMPVCRVKSASRILQYHFQAGTERRLPSGISD